MTIKKVQNINSIDWLQLAICHGMFIIIDNLQVKYNKESKVSVLIQIYAQFAIIRDKFMSLITDVAINSVFIVLDNTLNQKYIAMILLKFIAHLKNANIKYLLNLSNNTFLQSFCKNTKHLKNYFLRDKTQI